MGWIAAAGARIQEARLQRNRVVLLRDARQVAGGRMARVAAAGAVEIFAALIAVARDDIQDVIGVAIDGGLLAGTQEGGDVLNLIGGQMERGHAFAGTALLNHRADFVAMLVIQCKLGANQVRTAIAALRGGAVAKAAIADENFLPPFYRGRIGNRAADEHVPARARLGRGWGLGGERGRGKQGQGSECFHATRYSFTFSGWRR